MCEIGVGAVLVLTATHVSGLFWASSFCGISFKETIRKGKSLHCFY